MSSKGNRVVRVSSKGHRVGFILRVHSACSVLYIYKPKTQTKKPQKTKLQIFFVISGPASLCAAALARRAAPALKIFKSGRCYIRIHIIAILIHKSTYS